MTQQISQIEQLTLFPANDTEAQPLAQSRVARRAGMLPILVVDMLRAAGAALVRAIRISRTERALRALDDRMLDDIGIERTTIRAVSVALADTDTVEEALRAVADIAEQRQQELPLAA